VRKKLDKAQSENDEEIERINRKKFEEMLRMRGKRNAQNIQIGEKPIVLSDSNFSSEVSRHSLMVVDFWAPWCGPCRMVAPIIEELANDYAGKVSFGKLNVDDNPITANQFKVQSIPTILIFKNGQVVDGVLGAVPKSFLESKIKPYLSGDAGRTGIPYR
jgi:thioredoxin 1